MSKENVSVLVVGMYGGGRVSVRDVTTVSNAARHRADFSQAVERPELGSRYERYQRIQFARQSATCNRDGRSKTPERPRDHRTGQPARSLADVIRFWICCCCCCWFLVLVQCFFLFPIEKLQVFRASVANQ